MAPVTKIDDGAVTKIPVCIFAKPSVAGEVKTRLARSIGDHASVALASAMLSDIWSTVRNTTGATPVLAAASEGPFPIDPPNEHFWLQESGELGARIEHILRRGLYDASAAIALGADSPLLTVSHLTRALHELKANDAVIGPSCDGGFYLLGLSRCPAGLLENLPWSTAQTREQTVDRLHSHNMSVYELETLPDVDTLADLQSLHNELQVASPEIAPVTRQWFVEHRSRLQELQWSAS